MPANPAPSKVIVSASLRGAWALLLARVSNVTERDELPLFTTPTPLDWAKRSSGGEILHEIIPSLGKGGETPNEKVTVPPSTTVST